MANGNIGVSEGTAKQTATYTFTEDTVTKQLARVVLADSAGAEKSTFTVNLGTLNGIALETTVAKLPINQGASATGQTGPMVQAVVSTSAPSLTSGQVAPLSLTPSGELRAVFTNTTVSNTASTALFIQPGTGATFSENLTQLAGTAIATNAGIATAGTQRVVVATDQPALPVAQSRLATPANAGSGVLATTSSTVVVTPNTSRLEVTIVNDSDTVIYLRLGTSAVMNSGIRLNANGGSFTTDKYTGQINAIHGGTGTKNLTVAEI